MDNEKQSGQQNPSNKDSQLDKDNELKRQGGGTQQDPQRRHPGHDEQDEDQEREKKIA